VNKTIHHRIHPSTPRNPPPPVRPRPGHPKQNLVNVDKEKLLLLPIDNPNHVELTRLTRKLNRQWAEQWAREEAEYRSLMETIHENERIMLIRQEQSKEIPIPLSKPCQVDMARQEKPSENSKIQYEGEG